LPNDIKWKLWTTWTFCKLISTWPTFPPWWIQTDWDFCSIILPPQFSKDTTYWGGIFSHNNAVSNGILAIKSHALTCTVYNKKWYLKFYSKNWYVSTFLVVVQCSWAA
jgi:hypothetical protein